MTANLLVVVAVPAEADAVRAGLAPDSWNVKRVAALPGDRLPPGIPGEGDTVPPGKLVMLGDNPDSIDSRQRGLFSADQLLGVVVRRLGSEPIPSAPGLASASRDGLNNGGQMVG